ncbi:bZIP transcription factor 16, partial [Zea mays]
VIGGSRECSHHFLSIDISAPRLRPRIPKSCGASAPTPLVDSSLPNTPEESFSATRLPPLCRAGVDWSLLLLHGTIWFFFSAPRSTLVNALCQSTCRTVWVLTEPLAPDQCYGGVTVLDRSVWFSRANSLTA